MKTEIKNFNTERKNKMSRTEKNYQQTEKCECGKEFRRTPKHPVLAVQLARHKWAAYFGKEECVGKKG